MAALISDVEATWDDVCLISQNAPDIVKFTQDSQRNFFLNQAGRRFKRGQYADFTPEIQAYAAAHFAQMAQTEPAGLGPKSSESIGGVSASFTLPVLNTDEFWGETIFGRAVKKIMSQIGFSTIVTTNPKII